MRHGKHGRRDRHRCRDRSRARRLRRGRGPVSRRSRADQAGKLASRVATRSRRARSSRRASARSLNLGDCREKLGQLASAWVAFREAESLAKRTGGDRQADGRSQQARGRTRAEAVEPRDRGAQPGRRSRDPARRRDRRPRWLEHPAAGRSRPTSIDRRGAGLQVRGSSRSRSIRGRGVASSRCRSSSPARTVDGVADPRARDRHPPTTAVMVKQTRDSRTWSTTRGCRRRVRRARCRRRSPPVRTSASRADDLQKRSDAICPTALCDDLQGLRLNDDAKRNAMRANIAFAAGGAASMTATVMWFARQARRRARRRADDGPVDPPASRSPGGSRMRYALAAVARRVAPFGAREGCRPASSRPTAGRRRPDGAGHHDHDGPREFDNAGQRDRSTSSSDDPTATFKCCDRRGLARACTSPFYAIARRRLATASWCARSTPPGNTDDTPAEHVWTIDTVHADDARCTERPPVADNSDDGAVLRSNRTRTTSRSSARSTAARSRRA